MAINHKRILKRLFTAIIFGLLSLTNTLQSQVDFKSLNFNLIEENIFQRPITTMTIDKHGFIWIGTDGAGLFKFNGSSYTYYGYDLKNINSINSNRISTSFRDTSGRLWIGTDAGLCYYNEKEDEFKRFKVDTSFNQTNYPHITSLAEYKNKLLIGTYANGIKQVNLDEEKMYDYSLSGVSIFDLKFSSKGDLYIATEKGLKIERVSIQGKIEDVQIANTTNAPYITRLHIDKREHLWVGTLRSGIFKTDLKKTRINFTPLDIVDGRTMVITSTQDYILITVENKGLFVLDIQGALVKHYLHNDQDSMSVGSNSIWSLLIDEQERIWLGYYEGALGFFDRHYNKFKSIVAERGINSIHTNNIKSLAKTKDGHIWIAQVNGIDVLNTHTHKITNIYGKETSIYKGLKKEMYIESIFIDSKDNIWIATWGNGIFLLKKGSQEFINFTVNNTSGVLQTDKIRCFTEDKSGRVWIGSFAKGIYYYNPKTAQIATLKNELLKQSQIIGKDIKVLYHDSYDYIWIGTSSGLYHLKNKKDKGYEIIDHSMAISSNLSGHPSSNRILDIYETQDGTVWFGTNGGGLFSYNREASKFKRLELEEYNLTYVNAIFEPVKNELWISSKQGVLNVSRDTKQVRRYTKQDGLLENFLIDRAAIIDNTNQFYMGTRNGINTINPQKIYYNQHEVKPYLKEIKLFNKKIDQKVKNYPLNASQEVSELTLKHNQTVLTLDYESVSYTRPEKNQYAYFLEGFDKTWNYVGSKKSATYTNLASGDYTFKIKASNNDDVWNETTAILNIKVLPPWWKTIWAYLIFFTLFSFTLFLLMYFYSKRIKEKNKLQLERVHRKQKLELQQQKLQFFTNISHEFRTPLTLIVNPIKELIKSPKEEFSKGTQEKHQIIHRNAERLSRLINELMDFRKLQSNKFNLTVSQFNLIAKTKNILGFFTVEAKRREIRLDLKHEKREVDVWADSSMLDKIFFNLLSNSFKVTPNKGRISVSIATKTEKILPLVNSEIPIPVIEIRVKDNGPGIDQKNYKKIFKRFYQIGELNKTYYGSTGIGLEMVKSFVELHKGLIEVESELGKGSTFIISLPHGKEFFENTEAFVESNEETSVKIEPTKGVYKIEEILSKKELKKKLLIAEDNIDLQDYLVSILKQDYDLILASDGQEAWFKTMEHQPDIIITDIIMPIMDGLTFSENVKKDSNLNHIPIVILTAKEMTESRIEGLKKGAEAYLVKPFDDDELKETLKQLLIKNERLLGRQVNQPKKVDKETGTLDNDFIQKTVAYINDNIENTSLNVEKLSEHLCLSRSQVYRKIKQLTGLSPIEFIRRIRLERARTLFENDKNLNINEVSHKVGFVSASYFTACYKKQYGKSPKA